MIPFTKPSITDLENKFIAEATNSNNLCGDGPFTKKLNKHIKDVFKIDNFLLVTSCSTALDMTAILIGLQPGDEAIVPSFTFVSTANSILLRGATPVFCDIEPDTMNIDADKIEALITPRTKAIYCVHYAGRVCDMDKIMSIAKKYNLKVVEDAAQAVGSYYKGQPAGTIGDYGCYSYHATKNYTMGEGGALICKDYKDFLRAEIIREKGTDRTQFLRGAVDKYTWQDMGSSYLPSDVLVAMLYGQYIRFDEIMEKRLHIWNTYYSAFEELEKQGKLIRQGQPKDFTTNNAHMFYILTKDIEERTRFITFLKEKGAVAAFHYVPLHSSPCAIKYNMRQEDLKITDEYSARLVRLPLFTDMTEDEIKTVISAVKEFYK